MIISRCVSIAFTKLECVAAMNFGRMIYQSTHVQQSFKE